MIIDIQKEETTVSGMISIIMPAYNAQRTLHQAVDSALCQTYQNIELLIIDDFLANGQALNGLLDIIAQAGATPVGVAIAIEKGFQHGGDKLRAQGIRVESLAIIDEMTDNAIKYRQQAG